jgi:ATP/maltotriose-dependent transcriptional regulator MalT
MALSSVSSATAYGYGQLQRQVAQRTAEQLEAKSAALAAAAASLRKDADAAIRRAGDVEIQAGSARSRATSAWQSVAASNSAIKAGETIGKQADRIYQAMQSNNDSSSLYGNNGRKSSSSYTTGSIFKFSG